MSDSVSGFFCSKVCLWESTMITQTAIVCLSSLLCGIPICEYIVQQLIHPFYCWWYLDCFHFMMIMNNDSKNTLAHILWLYINDSVGIYTHKEGTSIMYTENTSLS